MSIAETNLPGTRSCPRIATLGAFGDKIGRLITQSQAKQHYSLYILRSNKSAAAVCQTTYQEIEMSKFFSLAAMAILAIACCGCTSSTNETTSTATTPEATAGADAHAKLCGSCGVDKGTEACCAEGAEKCAGCGLTSGSTLCCVELDEAAAGKDLCKSCGHVAGTEDCCAEGAEKCDCGMAKGSPLCCKLKAE